jgi:hypothetical protein
MSKHSEHVRAGESWAILAGIVEGGQPRGAAERDLLGKLPDQCCPLCGIQF